jgi:predicted alpha/beta superfamily hydrolase
MNVKRTAFLVSLVLSFSLLLMPQDASPVKTPPAKNVVIGKMLTLQSKVLEMSANLKIALPEGYESSTSKYPVLYTFGDHFLMANGLLQPLYWDSSVPDLIVVSFANCRFDDFTPTKVARAPQSGGADKLVKFFKKELVPFIDSHYRTQPYRIIFSGSWGGLFCTYALLTAPEVVNAAIACGPWLIYDNLELITVKNNRAVLSNGTYLDNFFMLKNTSSFLNRHTYSNNFLFYSSGNQPELVPSIEVFTKLLKEHAPKELEWVNEPLAEQGHTSLLPYTLYEGLKRLYASWKNIPEPVIMGGETELKNYINRLEKKFGYNIGVSKYSIRTLGWEYYKAKDYSKAIKAFQSNIVINPDLADAYYSLGRAYEALGNLKLAKNYYETACKKKEGVSPNMLKVYKNALENLKKRMKD